MKKAIVLAIAVALGATARTEEPSSVERYAESELRHWIGKLAEKGPDVEIRLGTRYLDLFPEDRDFLAGSDGFAVRKKDGAVYIVAPRSRGVLYGVYAFLERNSDIIWSRPRADCGTVYSRKPTFKVVDADFREKPSFRVRGWYLCGDYHSHPDTEYWNARMRCNYPCADQWCDGVLDRAAQCGFLVAGGFGHNLASIAGRKAFEEHPDWFGEYDGKRQPPSERNQFCYSSFEGAHGIGRLAAAAISRTKHPFKWYYLMQEDNDNLCTCAKCKAPLTLPDGRVRTAEDPGFKSDRFRVWFNEMMKEVRAVHPNLPIMTYAYAWTAEPSNVTIDPNVCIVYCPFIKNDRLCVTNVFNRGWDERARAWSKASKNVIWREYWGDAADFPRQHSLVAAQDLRHINEHYGIDMVFSETTPDGKPRERDSTSRWDASAMEFWVLSRLMWNPYADVNRLRDEYVERTYRSAAAPMKKYYAAIAKSWFSDARATNFMDKRASNAGRYIVQSGLAEPLKALLREAKALAADDVPQTKMLIDRQIAYFDWLVETAVKPSDPVVVPRVAKMNWGDLSKAVRISGFDRVLPCVKPSAHVPSKLPTTIQLLHDGANLYVRFCCADPNKHLISAPPKRTDGKEVFPTGDHIEMCFCPNDRDKLHLGVDVNGNRADGVNGDYARTVEWTSVVRPQPGGYLVDITLPLRPLGVELSQGARFPVTFCRGTTEASACLRSDGAELFSSWLGTFPNAPEGEILLSLE